MCLRRISRGQRLKEQVNGYFVVTYSKHGSIFYTSRSVFRYRTRMRLEDRFDHRLKRESAGPGQRVARINLLALRIADT